MSELITSEDTKFMIRSYGFTELGILYNPHLLPDSAAKALRRWIKFNTALKLALLASGWIEGQRKFTPLQTELIVRYLGEP